MASAALQKIIGGGGSINNSRRRRPQIGGGGAAGARLYFGRKAWNLPMSHHAHKMIHR